MIGFGYSVSNDQKLFAASKDEADSMKHPAKQASFSRCVTAIAVLILFPIIVTAATKCRGSDFACFKRKMMPKVGRKITVEGVLESAKLGLIVTFDNWGVYVYAVHDADSSKMNAFESLIGQTISVAGTLRHARGSPAPSVGEVSIPEHFFFDVAEVKVVGARPAAEIEFRDMRLRKPPLAELYFDIVLRNDRNEPRWFLLPSNLSPTTISIGERGGVDALEVFSPRGKGHVTIGHFLGTGGFQALRLPAHAEVRLRVFPISYWGEPPGHLQIEIVIATAFMIGGEKAEAWFGSNALSSIKADIAEDAASAVRMSRSKRVPNNKEVVTTIEEDCRLHLLVSLAPKQ